MTLLTGILTVVISVAMTLALWRLVRGPGLADRVVALDLLASLTVGWLVVRAAATGHWMYVDVALGIGLVSVVGTVAFGAFTEHRAREAAGEDRP